MDINKAIDYVIEEIADKFIEENEKEICRILEVQDLDMYKSENEMYEIFTNFIDSHLMFCNDNIQAIFEKSKYRF
ncbi:MAG: hypothetical protein D3903_05360 [Candidatus Electrothrix sp. GM3_4]|nr:hypothetical protein [Candidatus Electrothrix sp. GM3_4]